jgi:hypothetical protein
MNHTGFFDFILGLAVIYLAIAMPNFEPMGIISEWFFKNRPVRNWPFRVFYCAAGLFLMYIGFSKRFGS